MFKEIFKLIGIDGALHFFVSTALFLVLAFVMPLLWAAFASLLIGILKECYDEYLKENGYFSIKDLLMDISGICLGAIIFRFISMI